MFPVAIWFFTDFLTKGAFEGIYHFIYAGTAVLCVIMFLMGGLPNLKKDQRVSISLNRNRIKVSYSDSLDYELPVEQIAHIKVVTHSQQTTFKDYFLIDMKNESHRLPHYLDVPISKLIKTLNDINPKISQISEMRY